ncbi:MAG: hypothetical protein Q4E22_05805 [Coriobacteriia bacterium]|nr:hypothetical protein [Coriobacteriia bacterium]
MQTIKFKISSNAILPKDFIKTVNAFYKIITDAGSSDAWEAYAEEGSTVLCARPKESLDIEDREENFNTVSRVISGFLNEDEQVINTYPELKSKNL